MSFRNAVLCSRNAHKARELERLLPGWTIEPLDRDDYPPETGATYYDNALIKAAFGREHASGWVLGEDSGLDVDALIDRVIFAKDRAGLVAATKALDRVLLWNFYVVPQFTYPFSRYARWDRFSHAEPLPKYGRSGLPTLWWYDAEKANRIGKRS